MPYRALRNRLAQTDTWLLEAFLGLYTLVWGLAYANPLTDVFATASSSNLLLAQFPGGELPFGLCVAALGLAGLAAAWKCSSLVRAWTAALLGVFWLAIAVAIGIPTQWATGGLPHFLLASLANGYVWWRLSAPRGRVG